MNIFQCCNYHMLKNSCNCTYSGLACAPDGFYLTCPERFQIHRYDDKYKENRLFDVRRAYGSICFDAVENCFWALDELPGNRIYRLDRSLNENGHIDIYEKKRCIRPTGIDCFDTNAFVICGSFGKALINKADGSIISTRKNSSVQLDCRAVAQTPFGIVSGCNLRRQALLICEDKNGRESVCRCLPEGFTTEDFAQNQYHGSCCLYTLVTKPCGYSYIMCCLPARTEGKNPADITVSCHCYGCKNDREDTCRGDRSCSGKCREKKNYCDSLYSIFRSIAAEESAIAEILSGEGEKIQKITDIGTSPCVIMQANRSVENTLTKIIMLEQLLLEKLKETHKMCESCPFSSLCRMEKP